MAGGVAQGEGHKFKHQYHKKKSGRNDTLLTYLYIYRETICTYDTRKQKTKAQVAQWENNTGLAYACLWFYL
jgi:hypothetical protein